MNLINKIKKFFDRIVNPESGQVPANSVEDQIEVVKYSDAVKTLRDNQSMTLKIVKDGLRQIMEDYDKEEEVRKEVFQRNIFKNEANHQLFKPQYVFHGIIEGYCFAIGADEDYKKQLVQNVFNTWTFIGRKDQPVDKIGTVEFLEYATAISYHDLVRTGEYFEKLRMYEELFKEDKAFYLPEQEGDPLKNLLESTKDFDEELNLPRQYVVDNQDYLREFFGDRIISVCGTKVCAIGDSLEEVFERLGAQKESGGRTLVTGTVDSIVKDHTTQVNKAIIFSENYSIVGEHDPALIPPGARQAIVHYEGKKPVSIFFGGGLISSERMLKMTPQEKEAQHVKGSVRDPAKVAEIVKYLKGE